MTKTKRIVCAFLSVCLIAMPVVFTAVSAGAESIDSLQQQLDELESKNREYQDVLDKTQADIEEKEAYSKALVSKIEVLDDKIALTRESIADINGSIEEKKADIEKANNDIDDELNTLCERLRVIYMAGNISDLEIILGAKDFSDFIDKVSLVQTLSSYDKELIDGINKKLDKISEQKKQLEADKTDLEEKQASLQADQQELNGLLEDNDEILRNLYAVSDDAKSVLESGALESEEIERQIRNYNSRPKPNPPSGGVTPTPPSGGDSGGSSVTPPSTSGYVWPTPGFYYLSSVFGEYRGGGSYHGGIDIAGGGIMGATVLAADGGTVFASNNTCPHNWGKNGSCGCGGGYGNYVMIDHGNGKISIYGHLTSAIVGYGQTVSKGQVIGYVGSTGYSTGPHLHFECQYNGVKYDPMSEY